MYAVILLCLCFETFAFPIRSGSPRQSWWKPTLQYWLGSKEPSNAHQKLALPVHDDSPDERGREISAKRGGYLYGPSLLGNSSYFPSGFLGQAMVQQHLDQWYQDAWDLTTIVQGEAQVAVDAVKLVPLDPSF